MSGRKYKKHMVFDFDTIKAQSQSPPTYPDSLPEDRHRPHKSLCLPRLHSFDDITTVLIVRHESRWDTYQQAISYDIAGEVTIASCQTRPPRMVAIRKYRRQDARSLIDRFVRLEHVNILSFSECYIDGDFAFFLIADLPLTLAHVVACSDLYPSEAELGSIMCQTANKPFISVEDSVTTVLPLAKVTSLHISYYHLGISCTTDGKDRKLVILGLPEMKKSSRFREVVLRFWKSISETPPLALYSWPTEYWVSDSVVIDARSVEGTDLMMEATRIGRSTTKAYVCIGLPAITFGPLSNTLVLACNANAACFDLSIGYIWMAAAVNLTRLEIEGEEGLGACDNLFLSMINDQSQRSWLVEASFSSGRATGDERHTHYVNSQTHHTLLTKPAKDTILERFQLDRRDFKLHFQDDKDHFSIIGSSTSKDHMHRQARKFIKYEKKTGRVTLTNACTQLPVESLIMGHTTKEQDPRLSGSHGEGLKLAALVMNRHQFKMSIAASHCNWKFGLHGPQQPLRCVITTARKISRID
ncbi:hypothetical protein N7451_012150 [Penicillium sp. IBT 35674x]|nr:hypothetical protein N7451_012150 [Penicillium sp. IBT 35674x]